MLSKTALSIIQFVKTHLPEPVWNVIRSIGTAIIGPVRFAYLSGYWRSTFKRAAVTKSGLPLPWYTYSAIDFLRHREFKNKKILEFGGGQSTLWWAERADSVLTLEGDKDWFDQIKSGMPSNVDLHHVSMLSKEENVSAVEAILAKQEASKYDVIIIDGLYRFEMIQVALTHLNEHGVIICDNAEGYNFYQGFKESGLQRVDFFGNAPGTVLPHCTAFYFADSAFLMSADYPIPVISKSYD